MSSAEALQHWTRMSVAELEQYIRDHAPLHKTQAVTFISGGRRYTFHFPRRASQVTVSIGPPIPRTVRENVEALAAKLRKVGVCPVCKESFPRQGRRAFCSPKHAAKARKSRWSRRQKSARNAAAT